MRKLVCVVGLLALAAAPVSAGSIGLGYSSWDTDTADDDQGATVRVEVDLGTHERGKLIVHDEEGARLPRPVDDRGGVEDTILHVRGAPRVDPIVLLQHVVSPCPRPGVTRPRAIRASGHTVQQSKSHLLSLHRAVPK